jgi:hypothetical protein
MAAALAVSGCGGGSSSSAQAPGDGSSPAWHNPNVMALDDFAADRLTSGSLRQRIMADHVLYDETPGYRHALLENAKIELYDPLSGALSGTLWADAGLLYLDALTTEAVAQKFAQRGFDGVEATSASPNDLDLFSEKHLVQYRVEDTGDTMLAKRIRWNDQEHWGAQVGVLRGGGWFRQMRFQEDGMVLIVEGEGFATEKDLKKWRFQSESSRAQIKNERADPAALEALRPPPRPDAPEYKPRD